MPCGVCSRKMLAMRKLQTSAVSHARTHVKKQGQRQWRPQSNPPSRCQARTRDRAVTAGAQSHGTTAACGSRRTACAPSSTPTRSSWPRWRASAHSSAGGGLHTRFCKQVRAPIRSTVTHLWAGIVAHTNACNKDAFRKPVLRCVARRHSPIGHLEHNSWRRPLRQGSLGQPTAAPGAACLYPVLRGARLFQAERPDLASCQGGRSSLCGKSDRRVCILSGDVGATVAIAMHASP